MEREELFKLVNTILNETTDSDMEVINKAIERREARSKPSRSGSISPERVAQSASKDVANQLNYSRESIREMVQKFATDIIKQNAPELTDEQIHELLDAWVPDPNTQREEKGKELPGDVLITMAKQFISFAEGKMPPSEQEKLREEIPEWHKSYWEWFPSAVREAIALYLKGVINEEDCWNQVYQEAGEMEDE
ncbi:MAG: hypothetical protein R6V67_07935 [Spirochaetia bacterium]